MTPSTHNVPVAQCVVAAWGFFSRNLVQVYQFGLPYVLASAIGMACVQFSTAESGLAGLGSLLIVGSWFLYFAMDAALFRLALGQPKSGPFGLQLGADEARLFATSLLVAMVAAIAAAVAMVIAMLAINSILLIGLDPELVQQNPEVVFEQSGSKFWILLTIAAIVIGAILLYLQARFAPAFAAAIGEKSIHIFEAAAWTKGQGWRIALAFVVSIAPLYLILSPSLMIAAKQMMGLAMAIIENPSTPTRIDPVDVAFHWRLLPILMAPALNAVRAGLFATVYRGLRPA
ncbi:MAG: hypothetical protein COA47_11245 [Robiginitomaculum sp.]|nr:MAG: hypothetical protein COA47_11245 [Robiginitomaculum sp.]